MEKKQLQHQLSLAKASRHQQQQQQQQQFSEWIFKDVPSDITIEVSGRSFALHKFPLVSRSGRIRKLVAEHRSSDVSRIELPNLPGGSHAFELAAKFCYGINFEITPANVAQLLCASEFLGMSEEFSRDNVAARADEYLNTVVCMSLETCVEVLRQCESLLPYADDLKIVSRCVDAIAAKTCAEQIASSFSRLEYSSSGRLHMSRNPRCPEPDWWIQDISGLTVDFYRRVISAMKWRGVRPESIGASLVNYAENQLVKNLNPRVDPVSRSTTGHEKLVVETVTTLLPVERPAVPVSFLFGLLRSAVLLGCQVSCIADLERRIGAHLDVATLDDLLIPSFKDSSDTLFDVDTIHRIVTNFSRNNDDESDDDDELEDGMSGFRSDDPRSPSETALFKVAKLVDSYLAEIAPDGNLKPMKFAAVAESLPDHARGDHDGLYRAIDIYLKAHQNLSDSDKKRVCKTIDFQKLSPEAGAHAAQNERLPLQSIVQVLYLEQLRLRNSLACPYPEIDHKPSSMSMHHQSWRTGSGALSAAMSPRDNYASLRRENRELKLELARLRMRLNDLEKDHVCMRRDMQKSSSTKFMSSFSKKIGKLGFFGHSSSRGSTSPSKHSPRTDSKVIHRSCVSTE